MLTGANPQTYFWNNALKITGDVGPALVLSPAFEEGVQDAEFVVATDAGYGTTSTNLSVCALTNQSNIATTAPTLSCLHNNQLNEYTDPRPAHQPGGPDIPVGFGTKQVYYKAGLLFLAWTTSFGAQEGAVGYGVRPALDTLAHTNPQRLTSIEWVQVVGSSISQGAYTPSIVGTDEDDIVLVYNASATAGSNPGYPGIYYTGRKATDPAQLMGQAESGLPAQVIAGTHANAATWGKYSACAISLNSVTRGGIWCVLEYTGATPDPGWNTRLFNLRAE
jgi:hypothetical protein